MNVLSDFTKERADRGQHCRHHHGNGHRPASLGHYGSENRGLGLQPGWDGRVLRPWQEVRICYIGLWDQFCLGSEVSCPNSFSLAHQPWKTCSVEGDSWSFLIVPNNIPVWPHRINHRALLVQQKIPHNNLAFWPRYSMRLPANQVVLPDISLLFCPSMATQKFVGGGGGGLQPHLIGLWYVT